MDETRTIFIDTADNVYWIRRLEEYRKRKEAGDHGKQFEPIETGEGDGEE